MADDGIQAQGADPFDSIRIFEKNGETFIGKFLTQTYDAQQYEAAVNHYNTHLGGTLKTGTMIPYNSVKKEGETLLIVSSPAKIVFDLTNTGSGKASISWKIIPLFYKDLSASGGRYFYFNVKDITLSCIGASGANSMYSKILSAYKDIAGE